jgi:NAD(P)-dependent dehydrogenase (short-subunit alcohol dehydrogenase family)
MGDVELTRKFNVFEDGSYSISKAAVNMAVAKFSAEYAKEGVLFLSVCPGMVNTGNYDGSMCFPSQSSLIAKLSVVSEEEGKGLQAMGGKFMGTYQPFEVRL